MWTRDLIDSTVDALWTIYNNDTMAESNVCSLNTGAHVDKYVTPETLQEMADVLGKKVSMSPKHTYFISYRGCRFWTPMPWAD